MALNDATNSFRQDIEGLRAFAVLAVIVFHLHLNGLLRGGFLGVDVFFVVSGYLIGRQAHGEILAGTFSFVRFLRRRILRIAPALLAMLAVSGVVGYWVLLPSEFSTLGYSAAMAAIGLSNEYFRTTADYFDQASKSNPLLHTWSLGVEEQFYFILPLLLMIAARVSGRSPIVTALACAVLGTISFFGSWCLAASDWDGMAFYSVASRGWQLLLGVWIGTANLRGVESYRNRTIIAAIGLFAILVAFVLFDSSLTLPAPYGLVVCAGTAALLWVHEAGGSPIHWILSQPLIRYVGRISYSLYVWHWPVFVFGGMLLGDGRNVAEKLVVKCSLLAVTGLAGCVSYHLVEMPLRHWRGSMALVFSIWALVVSAVVLLGAWIGWSEGFPARFDAEVAALDEFRSFKDRGFMREDSCFLSSKMPEPSNFKSAECLKRSASAQNVILFGDSHAAHLWTGLSKAMPEINVIQVTAASCKPLLVADVAARCQILREYVFDADLIGIGAVILSGYWQGRDAGPLALAVSHLKAKGVEVFVVGPSPSFASPLPRLLAWDANDGGQRAHDGIKGDIVGLDREIGAATTSSGGRYISLVDFLCPHGAGSCRLLARPGVPMFFDDNHFGREGALLIGGYLRGPLMQTLGTPGEPTSVGRETEGDD